MAQIDNPIGLIAKLIKRWETECGVS